jgi:hypothetical protein
MDRPAGWRWLQLREDSSSAVSGAPVCLSGQDHSAARRHPRLCCSTLHVLTRHVCRLCGITSPMLHVGTASSRLCPCVCCTVPMPLSVSACLCRRCSTRWTRSSVCGCRSCSSASTRRAAYRARRYERSGCCVSVWHCGVSANAKAVPESLRRPFRAVWILARGGSFSGKTGGGFMTRVPGFVGFLVSVRTSGWPWCWLFGAQCSAHRKAHLCSAAPSAQCTDTHPWGPWEPASFLSTSQELQDTLRALCGALGTLASRQPVGAAYGGGLLGQLRWLAATAGGLAKVGGAGSVCLWRQKNALCPPPLPPRGGGGGG